MKKYIIFAVIVVVAAVGVKLVMDQNATKDVKQAATPGMEVFALASKAETEHTLDDYFKMKMEKKKQGEGLSGKTPFFDIADKVTVNLLIGESEEEALKKAESAFIEKKAMLYYAKKNGQEPSKKEQESNFKKFLDFAKKTEDFAKVDKSCKKAGFKGAEDFFRNDEDTYRNNYIISEIMKKMQEEFSAKGGDSEGEDEVKGFDESWKNFIKTTTDEYLKTDEYAKLKKPVDNSLLLIKEHIKDKKVLISKEKILKADVFVK